MKANRRKGQGVVEMALVLPIFLFVLLGIVDFGINLHIWATLNQQCVQAARTGSKRINQMVARDLYTPSTHLPLSKVEEAFWSFSSPLMASASYENVSFQGVGQYDEKVVITAQYNCSLYTPLISSLLGIGGGDGRIKLSARAEERKE